MINSYTRSLIRALLLGATAGVISLFLDLLLARITLGYQIPGAVGYAGWYAGAGAIFAALLHAFRRTTPAAGLFATTLALLYVPPLIERVHAALAYRSSTAVVIAAGIATIVAYAFWIAILSRVVKPEDWPWAVILGAVTAAFGLALNRNIVDYPLEAKALILDTVLVASILAMAAVLRRFGPGGAMIAAGGAFLTFLAAAAVLGRGVVLPQAPAQEPRGRNLVVIIIDTIRQDVFESVVAETEEGRRFRVSLEDAAWFSNTVAAAPWTAPSVGSIMTGLYPGEHGFGRPTADPSRPLQRLKDSVPTLAEHLSARGYETTGIVTNSLLHPVSGINRGFSSYRLLQAGTEKLPMMTVAVRIGMVRRELYQSAESMRRHLEDRVDRLADSDRPFFLWLHLMDPHAPLHEHPDLPPDIGHEALPAPDRLYRDEVRYVLSETAQMIELLKSRLDWDDTVTLVVGDHGEMFPSDGREASAEILGGDPMLQGHGHALNNELVHVPLVIRPAGGIDSGRDLEALVSHVDLMATISDLLGVDPLPVSDDRFSVAAQLDPAAPPNAAAARSEAYAGATQRGPLQFAIRLRDFKLIYYPNGDRATEVYDLVKDPDEHNNLGREGHPLAEYAVEKIAKHASVMSTMDHAEAIAFDRDTREQLEALGYLEVN
jgi:arylsulfatase A-like enzyme